MKERVIIAMGGFALGILVVTAFPRAPELWRAGFPDSCERVVEQDVAGGRSVEIERFPCHREQQSFQPKPMSHAPRSQDPVVFNIRRHGLTELPDLRSFAPETHWQLTDSGWIQESGPCARPTCLEAR